MPRAFTRNVLLAQVEAVFNQYVDVLDVELQQRACEYNAIAHAAQTQLLEIVCEEMPPFQEKAESALVSLVKKKEGDTTDRRTIKVLERKRGAAKTTLTNFGSGSAKEEVTPLPPRPSTSPSPAASPAVKSTAASSSSGGLADLLGLDLGGSPAAPAAAAGPTSPVGGGSAAAAYAAMAFGGGSDGMAAASPAESNDPAVAAAVERGFLKALGQLSGVLYEDAQIQIGIKSEFQGTKGRLGLYFGNKTAEAFAPFSSTVTSSSAGLAVSVQQAAPGSVTGRSQVMQTILFSCDADFVDPPVATVVFGSRRLVMRLPVVPSRFSVPVQLQAPDFFTRWKAIGDGERDCIKDGRVAGGSLNNATARQVLAASNISVLDGIDPNPANLVGASIFAAGNGTKSGILLRVQVNPADPVRRDMWHGARDTRLAMH